MYRNAVVSRIKQIKTPVQLATGRDGRYKDPKITYRMRSDQTTVRITLVTQ